jgi:FolB domain-containing protein
MKTDRIIITDLSARCVIGVLEEERREKQDVVVNLVIETDLSKAAKTDNFRDALDYRALKKNVLHLVENSSFRLLEALAEAVAHLCLKEPKVTLVKVKIEKPSALRFAKSVGVEITRAGARKG